MEFKKNPDLSEEALDEVGGGAGGRKDWVACCPACGWDMGQNRATGRYYCKNAGCGERNKEKTENEVDWRKDD